MTTATPIASTSPTARPTAIRKVCPQCGVEFDGNARKEFCSPAHKTTFHNLSLKRAVVLLPLLQTWRTGRHGQGRETATFAFREACSLLDRYNAEDRSTGRNPGLVVEKKRSDGWRAADLLPGPAPFGPDAWRAGGPLRATS